MFFVCTLALLLQGGGNSDHNIIHLFVRAQGTFKVKVEKGQAPQRSPSEARNAAFCSLTAHVTTG